MQNYNHFGLLVNQNESFVNLTQPVSELHSVQTYVAKDGKFNLTRTDKANGYFKLLNKDLSKNKEEYQAIQNSLDLLMNEKKKETKEGEADFELTRITYESESSDNVSFIGVENPLKKLLSEFKLYEESRERPLELDFPFYLKTDVIVNIPEGYRVEIPSNFMSKNELKSKDMIYYQNAEIKDQKLIFHIEFYLKKSIYTDNYKEIKAFFEKSNLDAGKNILIKKI